MEAEKDMTCHELMKTVEQQDLTIKQLEQEKVNESDIAKVFFI